MTEVLGRAEIDSANDLERREIEVPEWEGFVLARALSLKERKVLADEVKGDDSSVFERLVAMSLIDRDGNLLYPKPSDLKAICSKNANVIVALGKKLVDFNGMAEEAADELEGNSEATQEDNSSSS